jgi:hypothetical protein
VSVWGKNKEKIKNLIFFPFLEKGVKSNKRGRPKTTFSNFQSNDLPAHQKKKKKKKFWRLTTNNTI